MIAGLRSVHQSNMLTESRRVCSRQQVSDFIQISHTKCSVAASLSYSANIHETLTGMKTPVVPKVFKLGHSVNMLAMSAIIAVHYNKGFNRPDFDVCCVVLPF